MQDVHPIGALEHRGGGIVGIDNQKEGRSSGIVERVPDRNYQIPHILKFLEKPLLAGLQNNDECGI